MTNSNNVTLKPWYNKSETEEQNQRSKRAYVSLTIILCGACAWLGVRAIPGLDCIINIWMTLAYLFMYVLGGTVDRVGEGPGHGTIPRL